MLSEKATKIFINFAIVFAIFVTGFVSSMLIVSHYSSNFVTNVINLEKTTKMTFTMLGIEIVTVDTLLQNGQLAVEVTQSPIYDYIPLISGLALVVISVIIVFFTKKIVAKSKLV